MKLSKHIILASKSPRRRELLTGMGVDFVVRTADTEEVVDPALPVEKVCEAIALEKAGAITCGADELIIAADTVVLLDNKVIGKPKDVAEAVKMILNLSGRVHTVTTGVVLKTTAAEEIFSVATRVHVLPVTQAEAEWYVANYQPLDKAGAYGVQEWLGYTKVEKIEGSYTTVMGLPTADLYDRLQKYLIF